MDDYVICIPSYKRAIVCMNETIMTLYENKILFNKIYIFVANKKELDEYATSLEVKEHELGCKLVNKIIVGKKGLVQQREFIEQQWPKNKHIVFIDDDVRSVDLLLSGAFKNHSLDYFIKKAFKECMKHCSFIWGIHPTYNEHFRRPNREMSLELRYIVGAFYGIINRPKMKEIKLTLTRKNSQKEDVERSIKYFIHDGIMVRFNKIGFETTYFKKDGGGLGRLEDRLNAMKHASEKLERKYSDYGYSKTRKTGLSEFAVKKVHPLIDRLEQNKSCKNKNMMKMLKQNKTKKIKKQL